MQKLNLLPSSSSSSSSSSSTGNILHICRKGERKKRPHQALGIPKPHRDHPSSWSKLISAHVRQGEAQQALILYQRMLGSSTPHPDEYAFVSLLKACGMLRDPSTGNRIHGHAAELGLLAANSFVCSASVGMYARCGEMGRAREVFDRIEAPNVVAWTSLMSGYVEDGDAASAMESFDRMRRGGVPPDASALVCAVRACAAIGAAERGREIHAEIARRQGLLERNLHIGSVLVDMYARCDSMRRAREVFEGLSMRNVVTWNALIAGYGERGDAEAAIGLWKRMEEEEGIAGDASTMVCCVRSCAVESSEARIADGGPRELHCEIVKRGFVEADAFVGGALVDMYAKRGSVRESEALFEALPSRSVVPWNAILAALAESGADRSRLAFACFELMQHEGIAPDSATLLGLSKACGARGGRIEGLLRMHGEAARRGWESHLPIANCLIDAYAKAGSPADARDVFARLPIRSVVSWAALIAGYADGEKNRSAEALACWKQMRSEGIAVNAIASIHVLRACGDSASGSNIGGGRDLHDEIVKTGLIDSCFLPIASSLIDMYARWGMLEEARAMHGAIAPEHRDAVSWTALVRGYAEHGYGEEALESYEQMQAEEVLPDAFVLSCALAASGGLGALGKGYGLHSDALKRSLEREAVVAERLVDMYARCGSPEMAEAVFDHYHLVPEEAAAAAASGWNVLISGYAQLGDDRAVFARLRQMGREEAEAGVLRPDAITLLHALAVCSCCGLLLEAQKCFAEMVRWNCVPTIEHFACLVDSLGRAGQIDEALETIEQIPFQPNAVVWHALLAAACRSEAHLRHGILAFRHALAVNLRDAAAFVSASNACAVQNMPVPPGRIRSSWIAESGMRDS